MSDYQLGIFLIYVVFVVRAIVVSNERSRTVAWVIGSWLAAWFIAFEATEIVLTKHGVDRAHADDAAGAWFFIPTFIVPAIVGSLHARYTRKVTQSDQPN